MVSIGRRRRPCRSLQLQPSTSAQRRAPVSAILSPCRIVPRLAFPLDVRVQYLSSALANAKSSTQSPRFEERATVAQITDLEERSEVANVQAEVWTAVSQDDSLNDETKVEAMSALESKLMDVQEVKECAHREQTAWC